MHYTSEYNVWNSFILLINTLQQQCLLALGILKRIYILFIYIFFKMFLIDNLLFLIF